MTREQAIEILTESLKELFKNDLILLTNNVSERAITHKLAEYLKPRVADLGLTKLSVDCEYNRNMEAGAGEPKSIQLLKDNRLDVLNKYKNLPEEEYRSVTTFPDVIVHRRGVNTENLLIIEVKKTTNPTSHEFDHQKLKAFTECNERNAYGYQHGVFILLTACDPNPSIPCLKWFRSGREELG